MIIYIRNELTSSQTRKHETQKQGRWEQGF